MKRNQKEEIATIKKRNISISLSDADCDRLAIKAGEAGLTIDQLLRNFIGDLTDGTYSNGSDERMYANEWFDRCWFNFDKEETLLNYLMTNSFGYKVIYNVETIITIIDEIDYLKKEKKKVNSEYDTEELDEDLESMIEEYHYYIDEFLEENPDVDINKEIETCRKWLIEYENMIKNEK